MKTNKVIIINNRAYDPITGLPADDAPIEAHQTPVTTEAALVTRGVTVPRIHRTVQGSATLNRRHLARPRTQAQATETTPETQPIVAAYSPVTLQKRPVVQSAAINKFPSEPAPATPAPGHADKPAQPHPVVRRATATSLDVTAPQRARHTAARKQTTRAEKVLAVAQPQMAPQKTLKPAQVLKNEAIHEAMQKEVAEHKRTRAKRQKQRSTSKWGRFTAMASSSLAIVLLAGYFTYLNMPNLSLRMAATQSGINAKYPGYSPDGYRLSGPIAFKDGEVSMRFAYAGGDQKFTLTQQKSNWNSSAVREYVVAQHEDPTTTQVDGLTIYTYNGNAAWVNGGVLYVLEGNAPLSNDQIQRIATSM